jgi:hypothetical protein
VDPVSTTTNPVTQVADVAVKNASNPSNPFPFWVAIGKLSKKLPMRIITAKPNTSIFGGVIRKRLLVSLKGK